MRIKRVIPALAAALLSLLAVAPSASAAPVAPDDGGGMTPYVIDGGYAQYAPWAARLFSNGREACSASIIAPTWILTARHCVEGGGLAFRIGSLDQAGGGTVAYGAQVYNHSADLSLVRLDRSVSATYARIASSYPTVGSYAQIYGWGATSRCTPETSCQSRYLKVANVTVSGSCPDLYGGSAICVRYGDGITAGGDSGGPMMYNGEQLGVASTSDRQTQARYTNVVYYRSWIRSVAGV